MATDAVADQQQRVLAILRELGSVAVAFSAGADSTLVLKLAIDALGPDRVVAVTGRSDSIPRAELDEATRLAAVLGVRHVFLDTDEFDNPDYLRNPVDRCYHCKSTLYTHMARWIDENAIQTIVNGTNADDLGDHRPGLIAARQFGVRGPLAEAGLTKSDVRALSRELGLTTHDKPANPCLSSRVPYGDTITPEKLRMIERAEAFLREMGIRECRVRHHQGVARIEIPSEQLSRLTQTETAASVDAHLRALGFDYVTLDLRGFRSGSLNEVITLNVSAAG